MKRRTTRYLLYTAILAIAAYVVYRNAWQFRIYRWWLDAGSIRHVTADPPGWEYYLHVPKRYTPDRTWPVLVFVHGTDGNGRLALPVWRPLANQEGFFYLAPTFPDWGYTHLTGGEDRVLWAMIVEVQQAYAIDRDRVFVAGMSGGAQFVHRFAFRYPSHICGVSAMSAGAYDPPPRHARRVPFAVSVGQEDSERILIATRFARELKEAGYEVRFEILPGIGHQMSAQAVELTMDLFRDVALAQ
jgi:poly(3-hydroxybutyrate) depolymerase